MKKSTTKTPETPVSESLPIVKAKGRKALDPEAKAARDAYLKAEPREVKLARLANDRVKKAMAKIALIGNLSTYKPTDEQVDKIMEALGTMCARVEARMRGAKKDASSFTL